MELFQLDFSYSQLNMVDDILKDVDISVKRFETNFVIYYIKLDIEKDEYILNNLIICTNKQIKITHIKKDEELPEVGTDKPIGSKAAIDEN